MSIQNAAGGTSGFLLKTAGALKDKVTYGSIAEILCALYTFHLGRYQITIGLVDPRDLNSVIGSLIAAAVFFLILRCAARSLLGQFIYPDTSIWGKLPELSEREFEIVLERMEQMTRDQARVAQHLSQLILDELGESPHEEESSAQ